MTSTNPLHSWYLSIIIVYWDLQYFGSLYFLFFKWKVKRFVPGGGSTPGWITAWAESRALKFFLCYHRSYCKGQQKLLELWKKSVVCIATNHMGLSRWMTTRTMFKHGLEENALDNNLMKNNLFRCVILVQTFLVLICVEFPFKIPVWACTKTINNSWKSWLGSCADQHGGDLLGSPSTDDYRKLEPGLQVWGLWQNNLKPAVRWVCCLFIPRFPQSWWLSWV